jgi:hypothetical protein
MFILFNPYRNINNEKPGCFFAKGGGSTFITPEKIG